MKRNILFLMIVFSMVLFSACATPTPQVLVETVEVEKAVEAAKPVEIAATPAPRPTPLPDVAAADVLPMAATSRPDRLIVKNADLQLTVEDTDIAIDRLTQVVGDVGGYIISSRVWYQAWLDVNYKYASMTLGVPVDQFEAAMRRLRALALTVDDERAGGQDVTDEYVDLQSRLRNLETTRDRIRTFLEQAQTVEEALRVNEELKAVEAEIETVQGRMNYLFDRASYSTISVQLSPKLPAPPPEPTPTPTPLPEPWDAGRVAADASATLASILRALAELAIWLGIVVLPIVLPPVALIVFIRYWLKHKKA
ncbi:MAG TPA: DUF4349 domain-containing protein [Anaerolineae bacterium]|nr:DUF4349 domain-containing protein [Anaerolineae bacterium]HQH38326.1 DUF4349 domain-containing protein [Anaerolineae bacterium]